MPEDANDELLARLNSDLAADEQGRQFAIGLDSVLGFVLLDERENVVAGVGAGDDPPTTRAEVEEALATIADYLQEHVIDELFRAWPKCPDHEHPLSSAVVDGKAVWRCPAEVARVWPIGSLGRAVSD